MGSCKYERLGTKRKRQSYRKPRGKTRKKLKRKAHVKANKKAIKKGGNPSEGDKLMTMIHENAMQDDIENKKHSYDKMIGQFNKVEENDLYHAILRKKKKMLSPEERKRFAQEAYLYQEDPMAITMFPQCKYHKHGKCKRVNPVHRLADTYRMYHPATLTAEAMKDESF